MYVKKSEYARTVKRNEELEDQAICQYDLIKGLLKDIKNLKERLSKYEKLYEHNISEEWEPDLYEDVWDDELIYEEWLYD